MDARLEKPIIFYLYHKSWETISNEIKHIWIGGGRRMEDNLSRIQYVILHSMRKQKAVHQMHSMSCKEICDIMENRFKVTTIYKHICILEKKGYVEKGAKIERAYGYILTKKALDILPELDEEEENNHE